MNYEAANTPAEPAPALQAPYVVRSHDPEQGTRSHMYLTNATGGPILAYFVRAPRLQLVALYLHTPGKAGVQVYEALTEQEAVTRLQDHLQEQGYALNVHPLSD